MTRPGRRRGIRRLLALLALPLAACAGVPSAEDVLTRPELQQRADGSGCQQHPVTLTSGRAVAMYYDRQLVRVDIAERGIATEAGVQVGDPVTAVHNAYPAGLTARPHKYTSESGGQYLAVSLDGDRRLIFETDGKTVTRYRVGRLPEVEWVEGCA